MFECRLQANDTASREAFAKAAACVEQYAEKLEEAQMGRDTDYSKKPTPRDLLRLAHTNAIVSAHYKAWEAGALSWEGMLLALSVHLAEACERLTNDVLRREAELPFPAYVRKFIKDAALPAHVAGQPSPSNRTQASVAMPMATRSSRDLWDEYGQAIPAEPAAASRSEYQKETSTLHHAVMVIEPGPRGTVRVGFIGGPSSRYPAHLTFMGCISRFCTENGIDAEMAEIKIGDQVEGTFPVEIRERALRWRPRMPLSGPTKITRSAGMTAEGDVVQLGEVISQSRLAAIRVAPEQPSVPIGNCGPCKGKGAIKFSGGQEEKCAECGGSGNAPTL